MAVNLITFLELVISSLSPLQETLRGIFIHFPFSLCEKIPPFLCDNGECNSPERILKLFITFLQHFSSFL